MAAGSDADAEAAATATAAPAGGDVDDYQAEVLAYEGARYSPKSGSSEYGWDGDEVLPPPHRASRRQVSFGAWSRSELTQCAMRENPLSRLGLCGAHS